MARRDRWQWTGTKLIETDANVIAGLFERALRINFKSAYRRVIFAIVDWSEENRFIRPFQQIFSKRA